MISLKPQLQHPGLNLLQMRVQGGGTVKALADFLFLPFLGKSAEGVLKDSVPEAVELTSESVVDGVDFASSAGHLKFRLGSGLLSCGRVSGRRV